MYFKIKITLKVNFVNLKWYMLLYCCHIDLQYMIICVYVYLQQIYTLVY